MTDHIKAKIKERKKFNKTYINIDKNYRHLIAGQERIEKSLYKFGRHKTRFLSYFPYENCIWNSICVYEFKTNSNIEFNKSEVIKLLKSKNKFFRIILKKELSYDFNDYYNMVNIPEKLNQSYNSDLKVSFIFYDFYLT